MSLGLTVGMEIIPRVLRTGILIRLVLLGLLSQRTTGASEDFFKVNGVFASTELMEDLAVAEEEIIRQLDALHHMTTQAAKGIKLYIDEWRVTTGRASQRKDELGLNHVNNTSHQKQSDAIESLSNLNENSNNYTLRVDQQLKKIENGSKSGITHHPVDAFLLLRRTALDFRNLSSSLKKVSKTITETISEITYDFHNLLPASGDLKGAIESMLDLHDTYDVTPSDLVKGIVKWRAAENTTEYGLQSKGRLTLRDVVLIARAVGTSKKDLADEWFAEMAAMLDRGAEYHPDVVAHLPRMKEAQKKVTAIAAARLALEQQHLEVPALRRLLGPEECMMIHKLLCSGKRLLSPDEESFLSCRLERLQSPYLLLMPLKLEELSLSPRVVLYRDFLSETQSKYFIRNAKPELDVSMVAANNKSVATMIRVSTSAFVGKREFGHPENPFDPNPEVDEDEFLTNLNKRIEQSTGLRVTTTKAAESYQVVNYGIGGKYKVHYDFFGVNHNRNGDRLATFLMFLSDVEVGGATVFPFLGLRVQPTRGTALVWHNLLPSGGRNMLMQHAGCPVLHGNKWIATKWILYDEQFRKRPCSIDRYARL